MSAKEVTKLKVGDVVRLKSSNCPVTVTGFEQSGRVLYGKILPTSPIQAFKNTEVRKEVK